jgi:hypothetical protein
MVSPFFSVLESPPVGHMGKNGPLVMVIRTGTKGPHFIVLGFFNDYSHGSLSEYRE